MGDTTRWTKAKLKQVVIRGVLKAVQDIGDQYGIFFALREKIHQWRVVDFDVFLALDLATASPVTRLESELVDVRRIGVTFGELSSNNSLNIWESTTSKYPTTVYRSYWHSE